MHETVKVYSRYDKRIEAKHRCKAMVQNVREHGLPCHVSFTAGTYVCNCVMYNVLHLCATKISEHPRQASSTYRSHASR